MAFVSVSDSIYELMKENYSKRHGGSPGSLIAKLNDAYSEELTRLRNRKAGNASKVRDLISDKTIRNFFREKPATMQERNLNFLCGVLLDCKSYREAQENLEQKQVSFSGLPTETDEVNWLTAYQEHIHRKCGTMQVLDMTEPVKLTKIFTEVNVYQTLKKDRHKAIDDFLKTSQSTPTDKSGTFSRMGFTSSSERLPGTHLTHRFPKVLLLGQPGMGKTTFLKHLALQAVESRDESDDVPVYIPLKDLTEDEADCNLQAVIQQEFSSVSADTVGQALLHQGRCLILLDGLDEVAWQEIPKIYRDIHNLVKKFPKNRYVVTCRTAAFKSNFPDFVIGELAEFEQKQIEIFVRNWFSERNQSEYGEKFISKLGDEPSIRELTTNPLYLTMLCIMFQNSYNFPKNKHNLYSDVVDASLRRWDASRQIDRLQPLEDRLSRPRKINLFSRIAYDGFTKQPTPQELWCEWELQKITSLFITNLTSIAPDQLDDVTGKVLKAIESNHGIIVEQAKKVYSFSHLTLQEYFTAVYILSKQQHDFLAHVVDQHILDIRWHEVFLIIAGRLEDSDEFLKQIFKKATDLLQSDALQKWLRWLNELTMDYGIVSSSWRSLYLAADLVTDMYIDHEVEVNSVPAEDLAIKLKNFNVERGRLFPIQPKCYLAVGLAVVDVLAQDKAAGLASLQQSSQFMQARLSLGEGSTISSRLQNVIQDAERFNYLGLKEELLQLERQQPAAAAPFERWTDWAKNLRSVALAHLNIGHKVRFSQEEIDSLINYLYACNLLLDCMCGDSYSSRHLRELIVDSLLLPNEAIPEELLL
jgi:NACHT domain